MAGKFKTFVHEANFLSLVGNLNISVLGIVGFALVTRSFKMEVFGEWFLFLSAGSLIEMIRFGIIHIPLTRHLSGATEENRQKYIGSNAVISLFVTLIICILLIVADEVLLRTIHHSQYDLFFTWYPLQAILNLPKNTSIAIKQSDQRFGKILIIRLIESVGFFVVIVVNYFFLHMPITALVHAYLFISGISSLFCLIKKWAGFNYITKATPETIRELLQFSRYSTLTLIGTNLLRSADTFIISFSSLGIGAVALYGIPLKLTEIQQIPLRSFAATAFPRISKASIQGKLSDIKEIFYSYAGAMTYLSVVISLFTFVFAEFFVLAIGGHQYLEANPVTGSSAVTIVRVFSIYGILLPIERMTGVCLDGINKPRINFLKVSIMVSINIIIDLIAIFVFKSILLVAVGSVLFTMIGIWVGFHYLNNELPLDIPQIFTKGNEFYKKFYFSFRKDHGKYEILQTQVPNV